ncbi:homogentisate 1,2-dioxygenase [Acrocarpospora macrocephala]|uniref:Putative homogentisate 1,2-dioxygenase n=1 Tax=Acrocarpospora macrocephala TaxID=150177 RepID=A0A5M3X4V8_9ACTN|nr:homogentisate 1,2-dioxygenase domain-containing protein [Acrocarpospora macrocephala]GES13863.1 putative homogentisate 1,2-dioxygenase [Acrocarpospora macrocephala]
MTYYRAVGSISRKRHTAHRPDGSTLVYEEMIGEEGFSSTSSLLYHRNLPSAIARASTWQPGDMGLHENEPMNPRHFTLHRLFPAGGGGKDLVRDRRLILGNDDVRIAYVVAGERSPFYRNAVGDECVFIERGSARLESVFGTLEVTSGDYVVVPRGTTHRWVPDTGSGPLGAYCVEANSHIQAPSRYLSRQGQFLEQSPYCERDLRGPTEPLLAEDLGEDPRDETDVYIKHRVRGGIGGTIHTIPFHPFDAVGWDGCLYPYAFSVHDFEPLTGRVLQPPPVHQVFEGRNFVMCNFVPRMVDYHPDAVTAPYYHANVDSDEVMFYVAGNYEARSGSGVAPGSVTLHTGGHSHGPQPGAYAASIGAKAVDELAVMVDTFQPLLLGEGALASDDGVYLRSWLEG